MIHLMIQDAVGITYLIAQIVIIFVAFCQSWYKYEDVTCTFDLCYLTFFLFLTHKYACKHAPVVRMVKVQLPDTQLQD